MAQAMLSSTAQHADGGGGGEGKPSSPKPNSPSALSPKTQASRRASMF